MIRKRIKENLRQISGFYVNPVRRFDRGLKLHPNVLFFKPP
jgi:hypothetical protein